MQEQIKNQQALQKLLPTTFPAMSLATIPHVMLTKLASTNDLEASIELFECVATAWEWLEDGCIL